MPTVYFQIGTNDGNDLFRELVIRNKPDIVILVEPNTTLIADIEKNYKDIKNVYIYNNAIYYKDDETVELYIPAKDGVMGTRASNNITYNSQHFSLVPMNDWGDKKDMVKLSSKSITFDTICKKHAITNIEYLQIDTEGFDSEIIKMIDFSKYSIQTLRFEKWGFKKENFTAYNKDLADTLGEDGMKLSIDKLKKYNYTINEVSDKDGNDIVATLRLDT